MYETMLSNEKKTWDLSSKVVFRKTMRLRRTGSYKLPQRMWWFSMLTCDVKPCNTVVFDMFLEVFRENQVVNRWFPQLPRCRMKHLFGILKLFMVSLTKRVTPLAVFCGILYSLRRRKTDRYSISGCLFVDPTRNRITFIVPMLFDSYHRLGIMYICRSSSNHIGLIEVKRFALQKISLISSSEQSPVMFCVTRWVMLLQSIFSLTFPLIIVVCRLADLNTVNEPI